MPPRPSGARMRYGPRASPAHRPWRSFAAWKCVRSPARTSMSASSRDGRRRQRLRCAGLDARRDRPVDLPLVEQPALQNEVDKCFENDIRGHDVMLVKTGDPVLSVILRPAFARSRKQHGSIRSHCAGQRGVSRQAWIDNLRACRGMNLFTASRANKFSDVLRPDSAAGHYGNSSAGQRDEFPSAFRFLREQSASRRSSGFARNQAR